MYQIKEKAFSFTNQFSIMDERKREVFFVKEQAFSLSKKLVFQDASGREILWIHQKRLSWLTCFHILRGKKIAAKITKRMSWFKPVFDLSIPGRGDVKIKGNFIAHEFEFLSGSRLLARVSKKRWSWTDTYGVDISKGEDEPLFLAACVVIDQVLHDEN